MKSVFHSELRRKNEAEQAWYNNGSEIDEEDANVIVQWYHAPQKIVIHDAGPEMSQQLLESGPVCDIVPLNGTFFWPE